MSQKPIVVCGAGGFIGGHLVSHLVNADAGPVRAVDIKPLKQWYQVVETRRTSRSSGSEILEPINLGSSELVTINQLVDVVEAMAGIKVTRRYKLGAPKGVNGRNSDNTRIREYLGWEPSGTLRDGLERTYRWILRSDGVESLGQSVCGLPSSRLPSETPARCPLHSWAVTFSRPPDVGCPGLRSGVSMGLRSAGRRDRRAGSLAVAAAAPVGSLGVGGAGCLRRNWPFNSSR